jgi:hypothetical protein
MARYYGGQPDDAFGEDEEQEEEGEEEEARLPLPRHFFGGFRGPRQEVAVQPPDFRVLLSRHRNARSFLQGGMARKMTRMRRGRRELYVICGLTGKTRGCDFYMYSKVPVIFRLRPSSTYYLHSL